MPIGINARKHFAVSNIDSVHKPDSILDILPGSVNKRFGDRFWFTFAVLLITGLWILSPEAGSGPPLVQAILAIFYLSVFRTALTERVPIARLLRSSTPFVLLLFLAIISVLWSVDPMTTARKCLPLVGSSALALYFVSRLGAKGFAQLLIYAVTVTTAVSVALIVGLPSLGVTPEDGTWRGIFDHKNTLGQFTCLGLLTIACFSSATEGRLRALRNITLLALIILLAGSRSASSLILAIWMAGIFALLLWCRAKRSVFPALVIILILAGSASIASMLGFSTEDVLSLIGKDPTLTGRTDLWDGLVSAVGDRPFLGYGYQAFFTPDAGTSAYIFLDAPHAHNGFLEMLLDLGFAGLFVLSVVVIVGAVNAWKFFWRGEDLLSIWPLLVIVYTLLSNLTEVSFMAPDLRWIVFVAALFLPAAVRQMSSYATNVKRYPAIRIRPATYP